MYLMRGETYRTRALELKICQRAVVRNQVYVKRHNLERFAVLSKDRYRHYVSVPAFRQN